MRDAPIDFVIPWVDGSDPQWRAEHDLWRAKERGDGLLRWTDGVQRYREWGLLKYWFRGVEKFAPWVNRIHFITWGHLPPWLNVNHPKLHIVNHRDYIPEKWLPTFSSRCIELNIHRIDGLADQFVYFNDDMYLTAPVKPTDFFRGGLPCDTAIISPIYLKQNGPRPEINDLYAINGAFRKRDVLLRHPLKWFSPRYGVSLFRTLTQLPYGLFTGFYITHAPVSYLKETWEAAWRTWPEFLESACANRFRNATDVNQWLLQYLQFCTGRFSPRSPGFSAMYEGAHLVKRAVSDIRSGRHRIICWNDSADFAGEFQSAGESIVEAFASRFRQACAFERKDMLL